MKLGIDIRDLKTSTTGQKTYLEELCLAFKKQSGKDLQICLLDTSIPAFRGNSKFIKILEQINLHFWKQCVLPVKAALSGCDVLLCTDYFVPYLHLGYKTVTVFHDAFFFENKEHYHPLFIWLFKHIALPSAKRCAYIIVPSDYAKQQVIRYYTCLPAENIITIHEGPKTLAIGEVITATDSILDRLHLSDQPYLLHVGVMNKRKNIPFLLRGFAKFLEKGYQYKLVLAGSLQTSQYISDAQNILDTIKAYHLEEEVIFTGYLSNEDLSLIYQHAAMYVFPSLNEGFGLPVLEAFRFGLPVLVANNTCLPEIGGDAVLSFDPHNEADLLAALTMVADNPSVRDHLSQQGKKRLLDFSWDETARQIIRLLSDR